MTAPAAARRSRWLPWVVSGCLLLLGCAVVAGIAAGLLVLSQRRAAQIGPPNVEYVLDASPRMLQESDGATRLSVAEGVLAEIVRPASPVVAAGLRVFGTGQVAATCQDTDLLVPLAAANQAKISDRLSALQGGAGVDSALGVAMVSAIRDLAATHGPHSLVVVTGGADSCNAQSDQLIAQEAKRQGIQLQVFVVGYQVSADDSTALQGVVDQTTGAQYIQAHDAAGLRRTLQAIQAYVDQPSRVAVASVVATAGAASTPAPGGTTVVNATSAGPTSTALNTGVLKFTVLGFGGQPAEAGGLLFVRAFSPRDHDNPLAADPANPSTLRLPAGTYDLLISEVAAANGSPFIGGSVEQWVNGLTITAGVTTTQTYDMKLGRVSLTVLEAANKPVPDGNYAFAFRIYHAEDLNSAVASVIVTDTANLQLTPGTYLLKADYPGTSLQKQDQRSQTFEVKSGQSLAYTFDLKLGHLWVEVDDDQGRPVAAEQVTASAYPAATPNETFADDYNTNPSDLPLQAGVTYAVLITLNNGQQLTLSNQQVREGDVQHIKVYTRDFK